MKKSNAMLSKQIAVALALGAASMTFNPSAFAAATEPASTASQNNNTITVSAATDYALGGYDAAKATAGASVNGNTVTLNKGATVKVTDATNFNKSTQGYDHQKGDYISFSAAGGYSENNDAVNNKVVMNDGSTTGNVIGGVAYRANATGNSVSMNGGTVTGQDVVGGAAGKNATGNSVTMKGGTVGQAVIGGQGETSATGNNVTISGGTAQQAIGGYSYSGTGNTNDNTVTVSGGTINGDIYGGQTQKGSATGNTVIYNGGTVSKSDIAGGVIKARTGKNNVANNNTIVINSALKTSGYLYGGLDQANALVGTDDVKKGNTLVLNATGSSVNNIYNFDDIEVNANKVKNGETVVTVANTNGLDTDLSKTAISVDGTVGGKDGSTLKAGDTFKVISKTDKGALKTGTVSGGLHSGVSKEYALNFKNDGKTLSATVGNAHLTDQTKLFVAPQVSQSELVNLGGDAIDEISNAYTSAAASTEKEKAASTPWVHISQNRGHLSGIKNAGTIYNVGVANTHVNGDKVVTVAPFIEYGHGDYEQANTNGKSSLVGIGGMYRSFNQETGNYLTGTARVGRVKGDFTGSGMEYSNGKDVTFDSDGTYFAGQIKMGKIHAEGKREFVDVYNGLYFSHTPSESATLSSGESYDFDAINSLRYRIGVRHNRDTGHGVQYVGTYLQHEFAGNAKASVDGLTTEGTKLKGTTVVGEAGYRQDVDEDHKVGHEVALKGYGSVGGWSAERYGVGMEATVMGKF